MGKRTESILRKKLGIDEFTPLKVAGAAGGDSGGSDGAQGTQEDRDGDGQPNEEQAKPKKVERA